MTPPILASEIPRATLLFFFPVGKLASKKTFKSSCTTPKKIVYKESKPSQNSHKFNHFTIKYLQKEERKTNMSR